MTRDRPGTVAQGLFTFQFLTILSSIQAAVPLVHPRLDRDGGIAYLAKNTRRVSSWMLKKSASLSCSFSLFGLSG